MTTMRGRIALALGIAVMAPLGAIADAPPTLTVAAGASPREDTPVRLAVPPQALAALVAGREPGAPLGIRLVEQGGGPGAELPGQLDVAPDGSARLTFVLAGPTPAGASRRFRAEPSGTPTPSPWAWSYEPDGGLDLAFGGRPVLRYNVSPQANPAYPNLARGAYLHPVTTPAGAVITGDFSPFHPHHRGFFLAYAKAEIDGKAVDFWNLHRDAARIHCDRLGAPAAGPVTARFAASHRWEAGGKVVLAERWDVEAYAIPGAPYWLFDLTSTQRATAGPVTLVPYRYGGMAYRGPDSFQPAGVLDVRTSEGHDRRAGDQKPARWVDLTGPIAPGSSAYGGAMIADHPGNVTHPTVARIHPTSLPFFTYVPGHDRAVPIGTDAPTVFRYRVLVHDGRPDRSRDERLWRDFADPPAAEWVR
jgi:hypothetical protein